MKKSPIDNQTISKQLSLLIEEGAKHIGYYPDDFINNQPNRERIRPYISARKFPYLPE